MRALVVYESMFGNTRAVAQAVTEGLARHGQVVAVEVGEAPTTIDSDVDLVVVGGPTHVHGLSGERSRADAAKQAEQAEQAVVSRRRGVREWIDALEGLRPGVPVATFDTRFDKPRWLTGSAAVSAARELKRRGGVAVRPPESFFVDGTTGPVREGELERARRWGEVLAGAEG